MTILGFGQQPCGTTSTGTGTPIGLPLPGSAGYQQADDVLAVRGINLRTRDYDTDKTTTAYEHVPMSIAEQLVLIALTETPGRLSYALDIGDATNGVGTIPELETVRGNAAAALRSLTTAGTIELLDVSITSQGGALYRVVTWRDTTTKTVTDTTSKLK